MCERVNAAGPGRGISVLKFGSSVLVGPGGFRSAAGEVRRAVEAGRGVVAVVSARPGATDGLLATAAALTDEPPPAFVTRLLATGEAASVALLGIALAEEGIRACPLAPEALALRTRGPVLDAEPESVSLENVRAALDRCPVVVVPGFVGVDKTGEPSVLGRGGSDLTALFLAHRLGAVECTLVKDVDGIQTGDPRGAAPTERIERTTWCHALAIGGGVVQAKALRFAGDRGLTFRVACPGGAGTVVGPGPGCAGSVRLATAGSVIPATQRTKVVAT